jgi:K+-sensing histidine kinase KdpD
VEELLAAGIDVYTPGYIQHLESLNPAVAQTTGIRVPKPTPGNLLDRIAEIELVDLSPED